MLPTTFLGWFIAAAIAVGLIGYLTLQVKCLMGWRGRYRLLGLLPLLWLASWAGIHALDPAMHDMWPFEIILGFAPSLVLLLILIMLHFINTARWFETPEI